VNKIILYFILLFALAQAKAQKKHLKPNQFVVSVGGDTINRTDEHGLQQGLWNVYYPSNYGDESYFEIGKFVNGKKQGVWNTYSKNGIPMKSETYYNDYKNGEVKMYDNGQLFCIGNYRALRTDAAFDTILVEDPTNNKLVERIISTSLGSMKHGFWTYYKAPYNEIKKIEEYQLDELIYSQEYTTKSDSIAFRQRIEQYPHKSNQLPAGFWSMEKEKAPPRFTDFPENMQHVEPNKRKTKN